VRLFIAVDPGERFRAELSTRLDAWRPQLPIAWVRAENLHVTLRFLGEMPETALPALETALRGAAAGRAPLLLQPGGVGAFPDLRAPRVFFLQMASPGGGLERLAAAVRGAVDPLLPPGARDDRPLRAHLTLARVKQPLTSAQARGLAAIDPGAWGPLTVGEVCLMRSVTGPAGPVYSRLLAVALSGGG
jgi:RNA 2',3'-cyclic 3'-phosphodiesterase